MKKQTCPKCDGTGELEDKAQWGYVAYFACVSLGALSLGGVALWNHWVVVAVAMLVFGFLSAAVATVGAAIEAEEAMER